MNLEEYYQEHKAKKPHETGCADESYNVETNALRNADTYICLLYVMKVFKANSETLQKYIVHSCIITIINNYDI